MAQSKAEQRVTHPLAVYNFKVTVEGVAMRFAKVSGLAREHQTQTYRHGLSFLEGEVITKYRLDKWTSVTLEQGTVLGSSTVHEWLERKSPASMEVSLCDEKGVPVLAWRIAKALPVKITAPTFDARSNEVSIDVLELKVAGVSIEHLV